ncbi:LamG-like jellyroll fold domain-containing protein [Polymorphospora sp. NPDC051019]|uniref:LamG-like jellyroll fold domain-containing protein n=1 Tax=Polymorphospora sp. NPDC051019 TaxID=3155725 RepID=UPI003427202F
MLSRSRYRPHPARFAGRLPRLVTASVVAVALVAVGPAPASSAPISATTAGPPPPTVSGDPYVPMSAGTWNGGVGQPGTFTFGANGSPDVVRYVYQLNGGNAVWATAGEPRAEQLPADQRQVSTDVTGYGAVNATRTRVTTLGHDSDDSLAVTPIAAGGGASGAIGDTFATVDGDRGGLRSGMQPGKRYEISAWIYVPAATGLAPTGTIGRERGLRLVAFYKAGPTYTAVHSWRASRTDTWQRLSVIMDVPPTATDAFFRLYNGFDVGSGKTVYWDDLSVREYVGTTSEVSITPIRDGPNVLSVQSYNSAWVGSDTTVYRFLVNPSIGAWSWNMDAGAGTVAESDPAGHPLTFTGPGVSWAAPGRVGASAVTLAGTDDLSTSAPVLDTAAPAGFTVAAWARLTDLGQSRTAVSQDGEQASMFRLGYRDDVDVDGDGQPDPAWCFTLAMADSSTAERAAACTTDFVNAGEWVSLVGVYEPYHGLIKLFVNGPPDFGGTLAQAHYTGGWSATGGFAVGRAWSGSERWVGDLDQVQAAQLAWNEIDVLLHAAY